MNQPTPPTTDGIALDDLHSLKDLARHYPEIAPVSTLRWQLRHRDTNGLACCCIKQGKKLLIIKSRYERWLATRAGVAA
jgi:hypothetical protein